MSEMSSHRTPRPSATSHAARRRQQQPAHANFANNHQPLLTSVATMLLLLLLLLTTLAPVPTDSTTIVIRPNSRSATLVPGQPLHFECSKVYDKGAQFLWYKRNVVLDETREQPVATLLDPNYDDTIEIHNERLTLLKPGYNAVGDYICRALREDRSEDPKEFETIRVRTQPYVGDFGLETSHTGKSATIHDGERLELLCRVRDESVPVNITWLMSNSPDSDQSMVAVSTEIDDPQRTRGSTSDDDLPPGLGGAGGGSSYQAGVASYQAQGNVIVERVDAFAKRLVIREAGQEHRGHYACMVDNGVTERTRKFIYIRVKDKIVALWPFLGILAELFILFTIIYVWETQRAQKTLNAKPAPPPPLSSRSLVPPVTPHASTSASATKRPASGPSNAFESVPLNMG